MAYSEKELLLLSNFVYLDAAKEEGSISEILDKYKNSEGIFTPESVKGAGEGGGLDNEMVSKLFSSMQEECDKKGSEFGTLTAARRLEQKDVRGVLFSNSKDEHPVVVFRGTGGTKDAWQDNMYGGFESDTRLQKVANDFVKYECGAYKDITVTGHSKGGNLSQYVTVLNDDKISRCVSFDGQGMGDDFLQKNKELIKNASGKIKSISAYNDYVNILLTGIAGSVMYVNNTEKGINAHSSFYLLTSNEFDKNGNFISSKEQSLTSSIMEKATNNVVNILERNDDEDNLIVASILGEAIATMINAKNPEDVLGGVKKAASDAMLSFSDKISSLIFSNEDKSLNMYSKYLYFDCDSLKILGNNAHEAGSELSKMINRIEEVTSHLELNIASRFYADMAFSKLIRNMNKNVENMYKTSAIIEEVCEKYSTCELRLALQMQCYEN